MRGDIPGVGDSRVGDRTPRGVEGHGVEATVPVVREGQRVDMLLRGRSSSPGGIAASTADIGVLQLLSVW